MTLDEAIKHCEEKAEELRQQAEHEKQYQDNKVQMLIGIKGILDIKVDLTKMNDCLECATEHEQLAEWLKDYKRMKEERPQGDEWIDYDNTFYKCPDCGYLLEKCCPQCQNKVILPKGGAE